MEYIPQNLQLKCIKTWILNEKIHFKEGVKYKTICSRFDNPILTGEFGFEFGFVSRFSQFYDYPAYRSIKFDLFFDDSKLKTLLIFA